MTKIIPTLEPIAKLIESTPRHPRARRDPSKQRAAPLHHILYSMYLYIKSRFAALLKMDPRIREDGVRVYSINFAIGTLFFIFFFPIYFANASTKETMKEAEESPLTIDSQKGLRCEREKQVCSAEGQVRVRKGPYEMYAKRAQAFMRKNDQGKNEIKRIEAFDDIRFFGIAGETGASDTAIYDLDQMLIQLTPHQGKQAILWKDEYILKADRLDIHFVQDKEEKSSIQQIDAVGHVLLSSPEEIIEGDKAEFTPEDHMIIVTGDVRVTKPSGQLRGSYAKVNVDTKLSEVLKRPGVAKDERVRVFVYPEEAKKSSLGQKLRPGQTQ